MNNETKYYGKHDYDDWKETAYRVGWVHVHDDLLVCDVDDICVGEWDDSPKGQKGWMIKEYINGI